MLEKLEKPTKSARKAKGSGHLRRAEILEAAERIFVDYGYQGATIRKIAEEVGVSSTALYMHFRDKSEILVEISESTFGQLMAQNEEIVASESDPVRRVRRILESYMGFGLAHPHAYLLVFSPSAAALSEEKEAAIDALGLRCYEGFRQAVAEIAAAGLLRDVDVDAAAQASWAAAHGLTALLITRPNFPWAERETLKALTLDATFHGLLKP
jgi:AcrR family transcriptional regulator